MIFIHDDNMLPLSTSRAAHQEGLKKVKQGLSPPVNSREPFF